MSDIPTAWKKEGLIQSETEKNRRRKREGRGNKCQKQGMTVMHKSCISSCPQGTKKHCFREWELVSSHTWRVQWGSRQTSVHLFHSPGVIQKRDPAVSDEDFRVLWFQEVATGEDLNVLSFLIELSLRRGGSSWLLPFLPLFPSLCSVWDMVLSGGEEHHLTDGGLPRLFEGLNL